MTKTTTTTARTTAKYWAAIDEYEYGYGAKDTNYVEAKILAMNMTSDTKFLVQYEGYSTKITEVDKNQLYYEIDPTEIDLNLPSKESNNERD